MSPWQRHSSGISYHSLVFSSIMYSIKIIYRVFLRHKCCNTVHICSEHVHSESHVQAGQPMRPAGPAGRGRAAGLRRGVHTETTSLVWSRVSCMLHLVHQRHRERERERVHFLLLLTSRCSLILTPILVYGFCKTIWLFYFVCFL